MSSTNEYHLRPFDKLFVKDGRPLSLEDDSHASGLFPPPPSVLFGALRSAALIRAGSAPGSPADPLHGGALTAFALHKKAETKDRLYFPAPNDLVRKKDKDEVKRKELPGHRLALAGSKSAELTNYPIQSGHLLRSGTDERIESVGGYVTQEGLGQYLGGQSVDASHLVEAAALYTCEPKLGIGLDYRSGTTRDGLLYTMSMQRPQPGVGLCVRTEGFGPLTPMLRLGAESRAVEVAMVKSGTWPAPPTLQNERITLYLATPAVFKQGWLPDFLDDKTIEGELGGARVRLLAASVSRYLPLGGWDITLRKPKPMRRAVNAGAVYHLEIIGGSFDPTAVHGKALPTRYDHSGSSDGQHNLSYQQQGFGIAYVGQGPQNLPTEK
jgi:CRISPR-associated protein Cmr3